MATYHVKSGQTISGLVLYKDDYMYVSKGGTVENTSVYAGGSMYVSQGGIANSVGIFEGNSILYLRGSANYTSAYIGGTVDVTTRGVANNTLIDGAKLHISNGGTANSTVVTSTGVGDVTVASGGTANDTVILTNGIVDVTSGGVANRTSVESGTMNIIDRSVANSTVVNYSGTLNISSAGLAKSTVVNNMGTVNVSAGGTASGITVNHYGTLNVETGGYATITFNPWSGNINFSNGAYVTFLNRDANVYFGGYETGIISKGYRMSSMTVTDGKSVVVYSNGRTENMLVENAGIMEISAGGTAYNTMVRSGGQVTVSAGGAAYGNEVWNDGDMYVYTGASASSTYIHDGGEFTVSAGGTASNTTVYYNGNMYICAGGKVCGSLQITDMSNVIAESGAVIDFSVANQTVPSTALINNWSLISGRYDASYTITISRNQLVGRYVLADEVSDFDSTVTINDTNGTSYGTISIGQCKSIAGKNYTLSKYGVLDDTLVLDVVKNPQPVSNYNNTTKSDILQVAADGSVYVMRDMVDGYKWTGSVNNITGWKLAEARHDVTGDGLTDIQITCDSGDMTYVAALRNDYQVYGDVAMNYYLIGGINHKQWNYIGSADVDGDGKSEVLMMQTAAGSDHGIRHVAAWVTNDSGQWVGNTWIGGLSSNWTVTGTADVDGNGTDNIILRRADGMIGYWRETGTNEIVEVWNAGNSTMLTSGDFTGDGVDGILWTNTSGDFFTWSNIAAGRVAERLGNVSDLGGNWVFGSVGDYNGDGKDDILWRNTATGTLAYGGTSKDSFANLVQIA